MKIMKSLLAIFLSRYRSAEENARRKGVKIGKGCLISTNGFPSESYLIEIGDGCRIASKVQFFTHGGLWSQRKRYKAKDLDIFGKIKIGDYTYIGEGAMIMPGVTIGSNCLVGAGSVVTKSIPDDCMVGGNPIKYLGKITSFVEKARQINAKTYGMSYEDKKNVLMSLDDSDFIRKPYIDVPQG